jgi:hypothetical protein
MVVEVSTALTTVLSVDCGELALITVAGPVDGLTVTRPLRGDQLILALEEG